MSIINTFAGKCSAIPAYAKPIVLAGALGLIVVSQLGAASAAVRNTYSGAECVSRFASQAQNLDRVHGVTAIAQTTVICPIVKAIFNSTGPILLSVAASGGTMCFFESYDVFTNARKFTPVHLSGHRGVRTKFPTQLDLSGGPAIGVPSAGRRLHPQLPDGGRAVSFVSPFVQDSPAG